MKIRLLAIHIFCTLLLPLIARSADATGVPTAAGDPRTDVLAYAGGAGNVRFTCVQALAEGGVLIAGGADSLDWLPATTKKITLAAAGLTASATGKIGFILLASDDLKTVTAAVALPRDVAREIRWVKTTNIPGGPTGEVFISGTNADGYFLAKLDGNFAKALPTKCAWVFQVKAKKDIQKNQPWDVGGDGRVVFASGEPHSADWADVQRLTPDGQPDVVENWRNHWTVSGGDWQGAPAAKSPQGKAVRSAIVFKMQGRGALRSWTAEDYGAKTPDGNGGTKQGRWPLDYYFSGPWNPDDPKSSEQGPGYTGYRWGKNPVGHPQAVAIDRRSNDIYLGANNQSRLPKGEPDFEPYVIAFTRDGKQKWWQRLYPETTDNSTPDQYVDALAIDYTAPETAEGALVVLARSHGNNVVNFWNGSKIAHAKNPKTAFQNSFTGKNGNIHIGWLGRLTLAGGTMLHATYIGEWNANAKLGSKPQSDPNLDGWPSPNDGWPDLNTTKLRPVLHVDAAGNIYVAGTGRCVITTKGAHQKMPKPGEGEGRWSDFVRVYARDLTTLKYSSLVNGVWDPAVKGAPASEATIEGIYPAKGGVILCGYAPLDKAGAVLPGPDMPVTNPPAWAAKARTAEMGVIGRFHFAQ